MSGNEVEYVPFLVFSTRERHSDTDAMIDCGLRSLETKVMEGGGVGRNRGVVERLTFSN